MTYLMPDISSNNPPLTVAAARNSAKVGPAIMVKATDGTGYENPYFSGSVFNAHAAGLKVGVYHYVEQGEGIVQANHLWGIVKDRGIVFICVDWEKGDRPTAVDLLGQLKKLAAKSTIKVGAYEGAWAREHGGGLAGCDFVIVPDYGPSELPGEYKLAPYAGWQYTDGKYNGTPWPSGVAGIGPCDISNIEHPDLLGLVTAPKPPAPKFHAEAWYKGKSDRIFWRQTRAILKDMRAVRKQVAKTGVAETFTVVVKQEKGK